MHLSRSVKRLLSVVALGLACSGCASTNAVPHPFPGSPIQRHAQPDGGTVIEHALRFLGTPYVDGGDTPAGFDCSGFTRYVFGLAHVALPRQAQEQFRQGKKQALRRVRPGDLIFFSTIAPGASHVGVVVDRTRFIHAPATSGVVRIESFETPYWKHRLVGVRRVR